MLSLAMALLLPSLAAEPARDAASLPAPKRVVVPKLSGPIKIDGELSEPVWTNAAIL